MASSGMVEREGRHGHEGQLQQGRGEEGFAQFGQFAGLVKFKLYTILGLQIFSLSIYYLYVFVQGVLNLYSN